MRLFADLAWSVFERVTDCLGSRWPLREGDDIDWWPKDSLLTP